MALPPLAAAVRSREQALRKQTRANPRHRAASRAQKTNRLEPRSKTPRGADVRVMPGLVDGLRGFYDVAAGTAEVSSPTVRPTVRQPKHPRHHLPKNACDLMNHGENAPPPSIVTNAFCGARIRVNERLGKTRRRRRKSSAP